MFFWLIIIFVIALYFGFYYLGKIVCKKNNYLKKNINKNAVIILSILLIPLGMAADKEVLSYGIGVAIAPFLGTLVSHFLANNVFSSTNKKTLFFNTNFYYGFFGILIITYISLLFPAN